MLLVFATLKSLSSLLGDFFGDFWPGFLALDQNGDGTDGTDGRADGRDGRADGRADGRDGRTGRTDGIQFYSTTGTEKYSATILFAIHCLISKKSKSLF